MISTGCSNASQSIGAMGSYGVETMQASGADRAQGEGSLLRPVDSSVRGLEMEGSNGAAPWLPRQDPAFGEALDKPGPWAKQDFEPMAMP